MREFTQEEAERHDALFEKGCSLTDGRILLHGVPPYVRPGWFDRWQLRRAIRCFEGALQIHPEGWASMWELGKTHQRLGDQHAAFEWFARAYAVKPDQPDVAREAGVAALDAGRVEDALKMCRAAVAASPDDAGLVCNLALAHCLAGDDVEAERCAAAAVQRNPSDAISKTVLDFVRRVRAGKRARPKRLTEVFPVT